MRISQPGELLKPLLAAILLATTLSACASLSGSPRRVIGVTKSIDLAERYPMDEALRAFADDPDVANRPNEDADLRYGLSQQQYRDMVVALYMNAIDAYYYDFTRSLSGERREIGVGFDATILGLTTAASVARETIVHTLSAAAAVMSGTRSSIDRNLYFDQTLPGLLAAMDARRLLVRADMVRNMNKSASEYPLAMAFADLNSYEMAGSLDRAIQEVTSQAGAAREEAERILAEAVQACEAEADAVVLNQRLSDYIRAVAAADAAKLATIAEAMGVPETVRQSAAPDALRRAMLRRLSSGVDGRCAAADLEALIVRIEQATQEPVP